MSVFVLIHGRVGGHELALGFFSIQRTPNAHKCRLVALASYASGLRLPDTGGSDQEQGAEGQEGQEEKRKKPPPRSVPPLLTALCNEVEIM